MIGRAIDRIAGYLPALLATTAAALFLVLRFDGPVWAAGLGVVAAAAVAVFMVGEAEAEGSPWPALGVVALGLVWALLIVGGDSLLPAGDPIAVPVFARVVAEGRLLTEAYPVGSSGHAYPPGYPILFVPAAKWLRPDIALLAFKGVTLLATGLIPAAWTWMHRRLFPQAFPAWLVMGAFYAAFVVLERTLGFLTAYAGKNAVYLALLLFPGVAVAAVRLARRPWLWVLAAAPLYGLFLIHYSMVHLAAALLGAYALLGGRLGWREVVRLGLAGALAAGLLLGLNGEALQDPRAARAPWAPVEGLRQLLAMAMAERPALVFFHDQDFGLVPAPWRVLQLAALTGLAVLIGVRLRRPELWRPAATYGLALAASLVFAFGVVPARINLDFVRSYAWTLQACVYLAAALALLQAGSSLTSRRRVGAGMAGLGLLALLGVTSFDLASERNRLQLISISRADVRRVDRLLPDQGPCHLVGESESMQHILVTVLKAPPWAYAEAVSPCTYLNGSWVHPGVAGGRDSLGGFPSAAVLARAAAEGPVVFVGSTASFLGWRRELAEAGETRSWRILDDAPGRPLVAHLDAAP